MNKATVGTLAALVHVAKVVRDVCCDSDRMFGKTKRVLKSVKMWVEIIKTFLSMVLLIGLEDNLRIGKF